MDAKVQYTAEKVQCPAEVVRNFLFSAAQQIYQAGMQIRNFIAEQQYDFCFNQGDDFPMYDEDLPHGNITQWTKDARAVSKYVCMHMEAVYAYFLRRYLGTDDVDSPEDMVRMILNDNFGMTIEIPRIGTFQDIISVYTGHEEIADYFSTCPNLVESAVEMLINGNNFLIIAKAIQSCDVEDVRETSNTQEVDFRAIRQKLLQEAEEIEIEHPAAINFLRVVGKGKRIGESDLWGCLRYHAGTHSNVIAAGRFNVDKWNESIRESVSKEKQGLDLDSAKALHEYLVNIISLGVKYADLDGSETIGLRDSITFFCDKCDL